MTPTIGRIVHYYERDGKGPHAALITQVHTEYTVDLHVWPQGGGALDVASIDEGGPESRYERWCWPPQVFAGQREERSQGAIGITFEEPPEAPPEVP